MASGMAGSMEPEGAQLTSCCSVPVAFIAKGSAANAWASTPLAGAAMAVGAAMRLLKGADSSSSAARGGIDASSMAALLLEPVDVSEVGTLLDAETKALVPLAHKLLLANKLTKLRLFTREPPQLNLLVRALYSYGLPQEERDACRAAAPSPPASPAFCCGRRSPLGRGDT